jgi:ankyrin repeat protein
MSFTLPQISSWFHFTCDIADNEEANDDFTLNNIRRLLVKCDDDEGLKEMIAGKGTILKACDDNGDNLLHWSARYNRPKACKLFLDLLVDPEAVNKEGLTPLLVACRHLNEEIFSILIERGVNVHVISTNGWNCVHYAAQGGHVTILLKLYELGVDVDLQSTSTGETPLHLAAFNGAVEVCRILLDCGANIETVDKHGSKAMDFATKSGTSYFTSMKTLLEDKEKELLNSMGKEALAMKQMKNASEYDD